MRPGPNEEPRRVTAPSIGGGKGRPKREQKDAYGLIPDETRRKEPVTDLMAPKRSRRMEEFLDRIRGGAEECQRANALPGNYGVGVPRKFQCPSEIDPVLKEGSLI